MSDSTYSNIHTLLPFFGANNGTVFSDYSKHRNQPKAFGDAKTSTSRSKFYGSSGLFDGTGDYLYLDKIFDVGTGDFCIEGWLYASGTAGTTQTLIGLDEIDSSTRWSLFLRGSTGKIAVYNSTDSTFLEAATTYPLTSWFHFALSKSSNTYRVFMDGTLSASASNTRSIGKSVVYIGQNSVGAEYLNGNLQDLCITLEAKYTASFTPPGSRLKSVSGVVRDSSGAVAVRNIFAVPRNYSVCAFDAQSAGDGTYSIWVPDEEVSRVVMDDAAGTLYNDLIDRVIPG